MVLSSRESHSLRSRLRKPAAGRHFTLAPYSGNTICTNVGAHLFMRHTIVILLVIAFFQSTAQEPVAWTTENVTYLKGRKIKKGDKIDLNRKVKVGDNGHLIVEYGRWTFSLEPGTYEMDSVIHGQQQRREFIVDDSIYTILKNHGLLNCRKAGIQCLDVNQYLNPNYKPRDNTIVARTDKIVLRWEDRAQYAGRYFIVFSTMFDELIHLEVTDAKELEFNVLPFKKEKLIIYKVISEDCIESDVMSIRVE
jgi:hypothetical protein